jgi:hypothetical protein
MRRRLQHGLAAMAAWMIWGALVTCGLGQALPEWLTRDGAPKPPDFGVRDANGFFNRDSGAMRRISEHLRKLEAEHGYRIYLMVEPVLIASTAPDLADYLQQAWLPKGNGLVVVFEADSRSLGLGRDFTGNEDPAAANRVPTHETVALLQNATSATDPNLAPEAYIEALIVNLVKEFSSYFERRTAPPPRGRSLRFALLTIGGLALLALGAIAVGALTRLQSMTGTRGFRFPQAKVPERLGAPCGGQVSARSFGSGHRR